MDLERGAEPLAIPVARALDGSFVRPAAAVPDTAYTCAGCGAPLLLRRSRVRRAHFAHRGGDGCSAESVLHRAAKAELIRVVTSWKEDGGPRPSISRSCARPGCAGGVVQDLPGDITHAASEVRIGRGAVADVVLFRGEEIAAAVEVVVTHRVDREKAIAMGVPWVELDAEAVLRNPYWWEAVQDGLKPFPCAECGRRRDGVLAEVAGIRALAEGVAARQALRLAPSPPYLAAPHRCWRCAREGVVYLWPGGGGHSARRPPEPLPDTVRLCATEGYGAEYWANVCHGCFAVQGDHHLSRGNQHYVRLGALLPALEL